MLKKIDSRSRFVLFNNAIIKWCAICSKTVTEYTHHGRCQEVFQEYYYLLSAVMSPNLIFYSSHGVSECSHVTLSAIHTKSAVLQISRLTIGPVNACRVVVVAAAADRLQGNGSHRQGRGRSCFRGWFSSWARLWWCDTSSELITLLIRSFHSACSYGFMNPEDTAIVHGV